MTNTSGDTFVIRASSFFRHSSLGIRRFHTPGRSQEPKNLCLSSNEGKEMRTRIERRRRLRGGFTLLEVLLVLAILGVIAAMVVPQLLGRQQTAYEDQTRVNIANLENAAKMYYIDHDGEFPQGSQSALGVLLEPVDRNGKPLPPYLEKMPLDAWGQPLYYEWPNTKAQRASKPAIWSSGFNRQNEDGGGDDINNWDDLTQQN